MLRYTKQVKSVVQNVAFVEGTTLQPISIPTDLPISRILVTLQGTPVGVSSTPGTLQAPFGIPALAQALGLFTIASSPRDGSDGISVKQLPATMCFFDGWMMSQQKPSFTDLTAATPATFCKVTVPINFMDTRLPKAQQHLTALEAMRYGGQNTLNLSIFTGNLYAAVAVPDRTAIVAGTHSTPIAPGTLTVSVSVEQLVPIGFVWPAFDGPNALPFLDRDFEYTPSSGLNNSQSNNIQLNRRGIQANTFFLVAGQATTTLLETGINNLGSTPVPQLVEKLGAQDKNRIDPLTMQSLSLEHFLAGATWPDGVYGMDDFGSNLNTSYSLTNVQGVHQWDTNLGVNGAYAQQILRMLHITYNASARAKALQPSI